MAVFPWGHSRSRTTSSEKKQETTPSWFTRATTEPSRQALADLMKQHSRTVSGGSGSYQGRSRTNTASSKHSRYCSTNSQSSAAPSRTQSPMVSINSSNSRPESSTKSAVTRSEDSRRNSTKMITDSTSVSNMLVLSPPRFTPSRVGFRKRESVVSPGRGDSPRVSISKPFDFQHVTHTEQVEFNGLGRINETELATKFNAIQDHQRSNTALRGIKASELGVVTPPLPPKSLGRPQSPSPIKTLDLPITPPRPSPPPKDSPLGAGAPTPSLDMRMSRSIENFSRPTSRSASNISNNSPIRSFGSQPKLAPAARITDSRQMARESTIVTKPPQVPAIGHAVSTQDDTARCMISAPLPPPPMDSMSMETRSAHRRQSSSKGSLRHMSTFPSPRNPRPNIVFQDTQLLGIQEETETLSRHRSEDMLRHVSRNDSYPSDNGAPVDDWEGAIDYAWDHEDDAFEESLTRYPVYDGVARETLIVVQQPSYEQVSTPTTPLMMMMGSETSGQCTTNSTIACPSAIDGQTQIEGTRAISPMVGLGIEAQTVPQQESHSRLPTLGLTVPDQSPFSTSISPRLPNNMYSAMSKSSSQESIILSIASSILGTHRSSNSSVSPAEYAHLTTSEDTSSVMVKIPSSQLEVNLLKAARPESTCVPAALLQGFLDAQNPQEDLTDTRAEQNKRNTVLHQEIENDDVASLPMRVRREKSTSNPSIPIPQRRSSISNKDSSQHPRQRASATGLPRRQAAASYSLFPTAV